MEKIFPSSHFGVGMFDGDVTYALPDEFHCCDFHPLSHQQVLGDSGMWAEGTFVGSPEGTEGCILTALGIVGTGALQIKNSFHFLK